MADGVITNLKPVIGFTNRYTVKTQKFVCRDESGFDILGSDECYWVFTSRDGQGVVRTLRSGKFEKVDSGNERSFVDNVFPGTGDPNGDVAPFAISMQVWESDQGDPDEVRDRTQKAFDIGEEVPIIGDWVEKIPSIVRNQLARTLADDLMGSVTMEFSVERLARTLKDPGQSFVEKLTLRGASGDLPFEVAGGPDYDLYIRVTRVS